MSGHAYVTCNKSAPNAACNRAVILSPFQARQDCQNAGGSYQCCRMSDSKQYRGSQLIELTTQFTVSIGDTSGNIAFEVVPTPLYPVRLLTNSHNSIVFGAATRFNGLSNTNVGIPAFNNSLIDTITGYRVTYMGLEISANQQLMNQAGTISLCGAFPPDPYQYIMNNSFITGVQSLASLESTTTTKVVQGLHCAWIPSSNCTAIASASFSTDPTVSVISMVQHSYETFLNGWKVNGAYTDHLGPGYSFGSTIPVTASPGQVFGEDLASKIVVLCSGFSIDSAGSATTGALTCNLIMGVEVLPRDTSREISPGSLGVLPKAELGSPNNAIVTQSRADSLREFMGVLGKKAVSYGSSLLSQVPGLVAKYGPGLATAAIGML